MNQDPYLIWRLVVPHLDTLETIILLSKTSRGLYSVCLDSSPELRFANQLAVAVEQDRLDFANKAPGTWIPVGYWALYHCLLGHLELALEAASQTHKLHANTCIPFAKHCRYTLFSYPLSYSNFYNISLTQCSIMVRLPDGCREYSHGLLFLDFSSSNINEGESGEEEILAERVRLTCWIPNSVTSSTPTNDQRCGIKIPTDPCQQALQSLFQESKESNCNQYRVFSTSDGFCAEFVSAFEFLMSLSCPTRPSVPDFLNEILFHPNFSHLPEVKWAGYPIWRPLLFPSVAFVFEHPLSKFALVTSKHSFDFICLMTAWFQSIARIAYTMALFDANYPRFEDQTSDCISEMSLDFSEDGDDDDVGVDHVEEIQAVEEIGSPVTDLFEAASWNAEERINEGGVEDAYLEFRTEKEPVDETSDLDSEDGTESVTSSIPRQFTFTEQLMERIVKQIDVINFSNEKDSFLVIVKDCAGDREWKCFVHCENESGEEDGHHLSIDFWEPSVNSAAEFKDAVVQMLLSFGVEGIETAGAVEFGRIWSMVAYFLITAGWGGLLTKDASYLSRYYNSLRGDVAPFDLEIVLGYREILDEKLSAIDGYYCIGHCDQEFDMQFRRMERCFDRGDVRYALWEEGDYHND